MSVCVIAVYGSFSLLQALLLTAGVGVAVAGLGRGENLLKSKAEDLAALKRKMLEDITVELEHIAPEGEEGERGSSAAYEKLGEELKSFRGSLDDRLERSDSASIVADLHSLQRRIREEELDEKQCLARAEDVTRKIGALRGKNIASWERELTRLEAEMKRSPGASASEQLGRLQGVMDELTELDMLSSIAADRSADGLRETLYPSEAVSQRPGGGPDGPQDARACIRDIRDAADRIARMDAWEGEKLQPLLEGLSADTPFPDRLNLLRRQVRTLYARLRERTALTTLFREKLEELYALVQAAQVPGKDFAPEAAALARRCETLCGGEYIDRTPFMNLYEDICRFAFSRNEEIADALFAQKVGDVLDELGYELLTDAMEEETETTDETSALQIPALLPDRVQYLESPYEGYRVMIRTGGQGEVSVRLVRVVADEKEKEAEGEYQRRKDVETGQKWCHDVDGFLDRMREEGLPLDVTLRREPEESEVLVVVDRKAARTGARKRAKKRPTLAEKLRENAREIR